MARPEYHILMCQSFRAKGEPKGICHKQTDGFLQYAEEEILDRGLDVLLTATGCLKQCEDGPIMVVYPNNWWFRGGGQRSGRGTQYWTALKRERPQPNT